MVKDTWVRDGHRDLVQPRWGRKRVNSREAAVEARRLVVMTGLGASENFGKTLTLTRTLLGPIISASGITNSITRPRK
jgi:hypothetical protein